MKVKFETETEVLFDEDIATNLTPEGEDMLKQFDKRQIISYTIHFTEGVTCDDVKDFNNLSEEQIKQLIIKIV